MLPDVGRLHALVARGEFELDLLVLLEAAEAVAVDLRVVHEDVVAVRAGDEAEAFRGALHAAAGTRHPVAVPTTGYTLATRNPSLIFASLVMGTIFGLQRRSTGGIQAPLLTHLTWSTLMLIYLPPLFAETDWLRLLWTVFVIPELTVLNIKRVLRM